MLTGICWIWSRVYRIVCFKGRTPGYKFNIISFIRMHPFFDLLLLHLSELLPEKKDGLE